MHELGFVDGVMEKMMNSVDDYDELMIVGLIWWIKHVGEGVGINWEHSKASFMA